MTHQKVQSSTISSIAHDPDTNQMEVIFKSNPKPYLFGNVTAEAFSEFVNSKSIGSHFHKNFRGNPAHQVEVPKPE